MGWASPQLVKIDCSLLGIGEIDHDFPWDHQCHHGRFHILYPWLMSSFGASSSAMDFRPIKQCSRPVLVDDYGRLIAYYNRLEIFIIHELGIPIYQPASHGMTLRIFNTAQLHLWQPMAVDLALVQVRHGRFQNRPELGIATTTVPRWKNTGFVIRLSSSPSSIRMLFLSPFRHIVDIWWNWYFIHVATCCHVCLYTSTYKFAINLHMYIAYTRYIHMAPNGHPGLWRLQQIRSWMLRRPEWSGW